MPFPASVIPSSGLPRPGTGVPINTCVLAAPAAVITCPVTGFFALRVLPEHTVAPLLHPATYSTSELAADQPSVEDGFSAARVPAGVKKFDICPSESYCGVMCVNRIP